MSKSGVRYVMDQLKRKERITRVGSNRNGGWCVNEDNAETEAAIKEARGIMDGKIPAKHYDSVDELFNDALAEDRGNG